MVADGYYTAAASGMAPGGLAQPQYPQPAGGQPSWQPNGVAPQAGGQYAAPSQHAAPSWQQPGGNTPAPQQQPMTPWPQPAQATPWPQQHPGTPAPLAQYAPSRRRPARSEIPPAVRTATRLMYLGSAVTLLYVIFGAAAAHHYDLLRQYKMAGDVALTAGWGGAIGTVCWIVVATSCRRGHGWTRIAATILLALHTVGMLTVLLETHGDPAVRVATIAIWAIGLAAMILLWTHQAYAFFFAWGKRAR
jgi:hypothetical protein